MVKRHGIPGTVSNVQQSRYLVEERAKGGRDDRENSRVVKRSLFSDETRRWRGKIT